MATHVSPEPMAHTPIPEAAARMFRVEPEGPTYPSQAEFRPGRALVLTLQNIFSRFSRSADSQWLARILETSPCGIAFYSPKGTLLRANDRFQKTLEDLDVPLLERKFLELRNSRNAVGYEQRHRDTAWRLSLTPVMRSEKKALGILVVATDLSQQESTIREIQLLSDALDRSNQELERFVYTASHDLKEPIRMICTYLGVFLRDYGPHVDERGKTYLGYAREGAKRLSGLVESLLQLSRLGSRKADKKPVDLNGLVDKVLRHLAPVVLESKGTVEHDELPLVYADSVQLEILFQNLIDNAIKFRNQNTPPRVMISARKTHGAVEVSVKDCGIGIAPKDQEKIFQVFQRLHARSEFAGEGIGLAACKKVVESHGGKITVDSDLGNGSDFRFTLPEAPSHEISTPA